MAKAKPIAIIYLPPDVLEQMPHVSLSINEMTKTMEQGKPDYHWFVLPDYDAKKIELKVFYEKDFTHAEYHDLLKQINDKFSDLDKFYEQLKTKNDDTTTQA